MSNGVEKCILDLIAHMRLREAKLYDELLTCRAVCTCTQGHKFRKPSKNTESDAVSELATKKSDRQACLAGSGQMHIVAAIPRAIDPMTED